MEVISERIKDMENRNFLSEDMEYLEQKESTGTDALFSGKQLYDLIPQRPPIVMVDALYSAGDSEAETGLRIGEDNMFVAEGRLREPGLIEHIAQSAAAYAGCSALSGGLKPRIGYIAEIRKFRVCRLPRTGELLRTRIRILGEAGGLSLLSAETSSGGEILASCQMKIFVRED